MINYLLLSIEILLVFFILIILLLPSYKIRLIKILSLYFSLFIFLFSLLLWIFFNNEVNTFIYVIHLPWLQSWNIYYTIGLDGISIFFILLTTILIPICILISWNIIIYRIKEFMIMLLLIEFLLINVFSVLDLLFFYIFFESILIPMFLIIGIWGMRQRKIHAAYQFFFLP
jgi:NADH:ubiquinone oxidoreductase subunit 4 (subunit M)